MLRFSSLLPSHHSPRVEQRRIGAVAFMTVILLAVILGMIAVAVDLGYILLTRTQLQAVADASTLAAGTELIAGLGFEKTATEAEVDAAGRATAAAYAANNYAGDKSSVYADPNRDVRFGQAVFNPATGTWDRTWDVGPYNMVRVVLRRDQAGSSNGDDPLPLFFAPIFGANVQNLNVAATAVLMPANSFRVPPDGSGVPAQVLPFAYRKSKWDRRDDAQDFHDNNPGVPLEDNPHVYTQGIDANGNPSVDADGNPIMVQDIFDQYGYDETADGEFIITDGPDGILEVDLYPEIVGQAGNTSGNAGTIDFGPGNNSTNDIARQIRGGLSSEDLSHFENNELIFSEEDPLDVEGDTGISGGPIQAAFNDILGEPRAIPLFTEVQDPGNNAIYTLVEFVGVRVMEVDMTGSDKHIYIQPAKYVDGSGVPDLDELPGDDTTVFSPLILIE